MTVCTAAIFSWNYAPPGEPLDIGVGIVAASDRMLSDERLGINYESAGWKAGFLSNRQMILVAGAMTAHSELVQILYREMKPRDNWTTHQIAKKWSRLVIDYKRAEASKMYLEPVGDNLNARTFIRRSRTMEPGLAQELAKQMINYEVDTEALIIGCDAKAAAHLYMVDKNGRITSHDYPGFASIGSGGIHASAHFMIDEHAIGRPYYPTLFSTLTAKKKAEVDPNVGSKYTDMFLLTYTGADRVPDAMVKKMEEIYEAHAIERHIMVARDMHEIMEFDRVGAQPPPAAESTEADPHKAVREPPTAS